MDRLATLVEFVHALLMLAWIAGLPLLFWHRWPRLTRWFAVYALSFVVLSQASHVWLGECFITTLARWFWHQGGVVGADTNEWFAVRFAKWVFGMTPSHRAVVIAWEMGIAVTAVGVLAALRKHHGDRTVATHP